MNITLSFDPFGTQHRADVSVEEIISEIKRVIEGEGLSTGEPALLAGAMICFSGVDSQGHQHAVKMAVEPHHELGCTLVYAPNTPEEYHSLGDASRLTEVIENEDCNW